MNPFRRSNAWTRPLLPGLLLTGVAGAVTLLGAAPAAAGGELDISPAAVAPGGKVVVEGTCPEPVVGDYERATVGIDALGRYVVVAVAADGGFRATFRARGVADVGDPEPGDDLRAQVSCATAESYVASVGTVAVDVVTEQEAKAAATPTVRAAANSARARATAESRSAAAPADEPISPWIPVAALAVAIAGTVGAFTASRRSDQRAAAMSGHPAAPQRRAGRDERREAK